MRTSALALPGTSTANAPSAPRITTKPCVAETSGPTVCGAPGVAASLGSTRTSMASVDVVRTVTEPTTPTTSAAALPRPQSSTFTTIRLELP
ncbi:hypothetical protein [Polyangium mundeleinium]|uniref:Uncharacterized protein n=1 Tax=Polyangium mundeleinium TaxID=2995306 RepID=A0ABT5F5V0_9BACT|nr:hypothetical protein [Polyangium mundeleinium]MDC0749326.1 hypothetical protein [Polyangium mundeleinium]